MIMLGIDLAWSDPVTDRDLERLPSTLIPGGLIHISVKFLQDRRMPQTDACSRLFLIPRIPLHKGGLKTQTCPII